MSSNLGPIKHIYLNKENLDEVLGAFIMTESGPKSVSVFPGEESGFGNVDVQYVSPDANVIQLFEQKFAQCGHQSNKPSLIGKIFGKAKEIWNGVVEVVSGAGKAIAQVFDKTVEIVMKAIEEGGKECYALIDESVKISGQPQVDILDKGVGLFVEGMNTAEIVLLDSLILPVDLPVPMSADISEAMISSLVISDASGDGGGSSGGLAPMTMAKAMLTPDGSSSINADNGAVYDDGFIANAMAYANLQDNGSENDVSLDVMHNGIGTHDGANATSIEDNRHAAKLTSAKKDGIIASRRNRENSKESTFAQAHEAGRSESGTKGHSSQISGSSKNVVQTSGKKENNAPKKGMKLSDPDLVGNPNDPLVAAEANGGQGGAGAAMAAGGILRNDSGAAASDYVASLEEGGQERVGSTDNQGESHEGNHSENENETPDKNDQGTGAALA